MSYASRWGWNRWHSSDRRWCGTVPETWARAVVALMHHRTGQVFLRWPAATFAAALLLGCHLGDQRDARACPQTGEFANFGCAVVEGAVVGARGQPLGGVAVAPGSSADGGQFDTPFHYTDASGRFQLRLTRYVPAPSDSASVWIHASVLPTPPEVVSTVHDSALVRLLIAPVGHLPDTAHVSIVLQVP